MEAAAKLTVINSPYVREKVQHKSAKINVLAVQNVSKSYGKKNALKNINATFYKGETTAIMGPNGAGKTTLMELLSGLYRPDANGEILAFDNTIKHGSKEYIAKIGVQLQETQLFVRATARDYLEFFTSLYRKTLPITEITSWLNLNDYLDAEIRKLSGGMAQRVALALAVINDPEIVMLDEPTVGLDPLSRRDLWDCLKSLKTRNKTLIFTTHYMDEAVSLSDRILLMANGKIVFSGTPDDIKAKAKEFGGNLDQVFEHYVYAVEGEDECTQNN